VRWQDGKSKKMEVRRDFSIVTLAQRLVRKKGEEGFYLYLKRQSEGTWIEFQVSHHKQMSKSQELGYTI
jgi:hypothetical protein